MDEQKDLTQEEAAAQRLARDLRNQQLRSEATQKKLDLRARVLRGEITEEEAMKEAMRS
jgi:hypothetical protein